MDLALAVTEALHPREEWQAHRRIPEDHAENPGLVSDTVYLLLKDRHDLSEETFERSS